MIKRNYWFVTRLGHVGKLKSSTMHGKLFWTDSKPYEDDDYFDLCLDSDETGRPLALGGYTQWMTIADSEKEAKAIALGITLANKWMKDYIDGY